MVAEELLTGFLLSSGLHKTGKQVKVLDVNQTWKVKHGRWTHFGRAKVQGHVMMHTYIP